MKRSMRKGTYSRSAEGRIAMNEVESKKSVWQKASLVDSDCSSVSCAERELRNFIHSVSDLIRAEEGAFLREVWLDEVASLARTPEPTSTDWHLVTIGAYLRLAQHLVEKHDPWEFVG